MEIRKITLPATSDEDRHWLEEACALWRTCFGAELLSELRPQLAGEEVAFNKDAVYLALEDGRVASTCHLTRSCALSWAGIGEVATASDFRQRGLSRKVVGAALDDFDGTGGEAVWLGTVNPVAASVYQGLGFGYLPDTSVMQRLCQGLSPIDFARRWTDPAGARILEGSPACRIPMIPLLTSKLGIETLDDIVGLTGTEFKPQHSCMGLYPKYAALAAAGGGWLALVNGKGAVLGLSTREPSAAGKARTAGFCHPRAADWREALIR